MSPTDEGGSGEREQSCLGRGVNRRLIGAGDRGASLFAPRRAGLFRRDENSGTATAGGAHDLCDPERPDDAESRGDEGDPAAAETERTTVATTMPATCQEANARASCLTGARAVAWPSSGITMRIRAPELGGADPEDAEDERGHP